MLTGLPLLVFSRSTLGAKGPFIVGWRTDIITSNTAHRSEMSVKVFGRAAKLLISRGTRVVQSACSCTRNEGEFLFCHQKRGSSFVFILGLKIVDCSCVTSFKWEIQEKTEKPTRKRNICFCVKPLQMQMQSREQKTKDILLKIRLLFLHRETPQIKFASY